MAQNTSISLDDHFVDFLSREVSSGRYRSASEVVRAGLRLLEDQETQLAALRAALVAGEESGAPEAFDFDEIREGYHRYRIRSHVLFYVESTEPRAFMTVGGL